MSVMETERVDAGSAASREAARQGARLRARSQRRYFTLFVFPAVALFVLVLIGPTVFSVGVSLFQWNGLTSPEWRGLRNYEILFRDPTFMRALINTLVILCAGGVYFVISLSASLLVSWLKKRTV